MILGRLFSSHGIKWRKPMSLYFVKDSCVVTVLVRGLCRYSGEYGEKIDFVVVMERSVTL